MKHLLHLALQELDQGRKTVLAVITAAQGSTPRSTGAAMLVGETGLLSGTIGGGTLEYQCTQLAFAPDSPLMDFSLDNHHAAELGMVCGGSAQVLFVPLTDRELLLQAQTQQDSTLLLPLDGGAPFLSPEVWLTPTRVSQQNRELLCIPLAEPGRIFLFGGGHVSLALSRILDVLEYPYLVIDDREEFSDPLRFPGAIQTLTADFTILEAVLKGSLAPGELDCLCILSRGHLSDMDALRFALTTPAGYIGLMGSRKKRERIFAQLREEGFGAPQARIQTPIGIPLGGQTPAEVAISIAAQLVQHRCSVV